MAGDGWTPIDLSNVKGAYTDTESSTSRENVTPSGGYQSKGIDLSRARGIRGDEEEQAPPSPSPSPSPLMRQGDFNSVDPTAGFIQPKIQPKPQPPKPYSGKVSNTLGKNPYDIPSDVIAPASLNLVNDALKVAMPGAKYDDTVFDNDPVINVGVDSHTRMSYWAAKGLQQSINEAKKAGITIDPFGPLTSTRTYEQQAGLKASKGKLASNPGKDKHTGSLHQFGFAIDVSSDNYDDLDKIMEKRGFARSVHGEKWHYSFQPALPSNDPERVWKDNDPRMAQWKNTLGYAARGSIDDIIVNSSTMHGFGPKATSVINRMFTQESGKRTHDDNGDIIMSPVGAAGIGQMMPGTLAPYLKERGITQKEWENSPNLQIDISVEHLKKLINQYDGNMAKALAAYNGGDGAVMSAEKNGGYRPSDDPNSWYVQTVDYVSKIMDISRDDAMKYISAPKGTVIPEVMADYREPGDLSHVSRDVGKGVDAWYKTMLGSAATATQEEGESIEDFQFRIEKEFLDQQPSAVNQDLAYSGVSFLRGVTSFVTDIVGSELQSWGDKDAKASDMVPFYGELSKIEGFGTPESRATLGDFVPGYSEIKSAAKWSGIGDDSAAWVGNKLRKVAEILQPETAVQAEHDEWYEGSGGINQRRGADSFPQYVMGLLWGKEDGGTDLSLDAIQANMESLGLEFPYLFGTMVGGMIMRGGLNTFAGTPVRNVIADAPAKEAVRIAEHWAKNPTATNAFMRITNGLTLGAAGKLAGGVGKAVSNAGVEAVADVLAYGWIGGAQSGSLAYSDALTRGATMQEAAAEGITAAAVGVASGLALPLMFSRPVVGGAVEGAAGAAGKVIRAGASAAEPLTGPLPTNYPWKEYVGKSVTDLVKALDEAMVPGAVEGMEGKYGPFTRRVAKAFRFFREQTENSQRIDHINAVADDLQATAGTYDNAASTIDQQLATHQEHITALQESRQAANEMVQYLERNPNLKVFGKGNETQPGWIPRLEKTEAIVQQAQSLPGKTIEEQQAWIQENQELMQAAGAKDVSELLAPSSKKGGDVTTPGPSKLDNWAQGEKKKIIGEAGTKGISAGQIGEYRRNLNKVRDIDSAIEKVQKSPIAQGIAKFQEASRVLKGTANQIRAQADWMTQNIENPFENIGPQDKVVLNATPIHPASGLDPLQLQAQLETFQGQIKQLAKDGTWMGAGKDAYAFEATRQTRSLLQASGIFGEDIIENAVQSVNDGKLWVAADIGSVKNSIKSAKATIERIDQAGSQENQLKRQTKEVKTLRNRLDRHADRLDKLDTERDFLEKSLGELEKNRLLPDATPENITEYRNTLAAAQKKLRYAERVKANIKSRKNLVKESERNIDNAQFEQAVREHPRLNYGRLADYDAIIDANKIGIKRANRSIDYSKAKLSDIEAELKDARNITGKLTEDLDALTRKRDYLKRKEYLDEEIPKAQKDVNKATGDLEGHTKLFAEREAKKQKRRDIKKSVLEDQIALNESSLSRMEGVEAVYQGAEQGLKDTHEQLVTAVPSTRPGDKGDPAGFFNQMSSLPDIGSVAAKFDEVSKQEQSFNPLGGIVKMWSDLTADQRKSLYARELLAATDNFLNKVNPQREALKEAGGHPDIWKLFDEKTFSPDQGIASLISKEVWQAAYGLRASEINASNVAANPLSGVLREGTKGALDNLKAFVDLDTPTSVTQMLARGRNTFKTMVHQTNHARQISARVRDVWNHTMENMDPAYTEGRVGKKVLRPEMAKEMVGAIEGMMDGPGAMREFLQKYPGMRDPMQLYLGVTRVAEQYKVVSPELRSAFRDGYFQHKYPYAREILGRGRRVDWDRINTQLSSENARKIDSLSRANELYTSAVDELKNSGYTGTAEKNLEKEFIGGTHEKRAKMLGITDDPLSKKAFDKVNWTLDRLALKDPITDPGHIMESMLKSTFETAALRNALKNGANIPVKMINPKTDRPFNAIFPSVNGDTPDMPLAAGGVGPARILSKEFNLADHDVLTFGGKDYKAGDMRIHPDLADEIKYNFTNQANTNTKHRAAVDLSRSLQLMGSPMAHSWNILSGHWNNLSINALNSIANSAIKSAKGIAHLSPTEIAEGMQGVWKGGKDFLFSPVDAVSMGVLGNKALSGDIPGIDPQMLVTDALTHGLNLNMFETTMRSAQDMSLKWLEREDPEMVAEMRKGFLERVTTRGNTPQQIWDEVVGEEGLWGNLKHINSSADPSVKDVAKTIGAVGEAGVKGLINGDHFLNNYFTYEPMRQAAIAAYNLTAAVHWERVGTALMDNGVPFSQALKMVKEEVARRINGLNGTLQSYQKIANGRGAFDWENSMYGTSGNQGVNIASTFLNGTTPGWLRSKIDFISNGITGSRLKDIENEQFRSYMQKEWRKQLGVGMAVGVTAQQLLQYLVSGGTSGVFAAAFDPSNEGGRMDALRETMSDPKLLTEIRLGSNTVISTPFYGQLRDMVNLTDGIIRRPENIANLIEGNISKLGLGMIETIANRDLQTGKNIRIDDTSLDPDAKFNWARDSAAHLAGKVTGTMRSDVFMQDTRKGGMKPMSAIAGTILGLNVRENNPEQKMSVEMYSRVKAEQDQTRANADSYAREFARTGNWEYYEKGMKALVDPEDSVTGAAKNWTMIFPKGKATLDPKEFANMVMKYKNPAIYVLNTADPKFRMEYMRRLQKWKNVQQNLYFDKLFDEHYTSGEQTLKQEAADE